MQDSFEILLYKAELHKNEQIQNINQKVLLKTQTQNITHEHLNNTKERKT